MWCWRRHLRISLEVRRLNESILKEINTEYSLEGLMLKLKLQYFDHLMQSADSLEKTLILGKTEGRGRRRWLRIRCLYGIICSMNVSLANSEKQWRTGKPCFLQSMWLQQFRQQDWATEQQSTYLYLFILLKYLSIMCQLIAFKIILSCLWKWN